MKVLVDTSIWSLVLRRKKENLNQTEQVILSELTELISESRVVMIGQVRQEILSGISSVKQFKNLKNSLRAFDDLELTTDDYEIAAECFNRCKRNGVQGSFVDFLICAVAMNNNLSIFTSDKDFRNYSNHLDLNIHNCR